MVLPAARADRRDDPLIMYDATRSCAHRLGFRRTVCPNPSTVSSRPAARELAIRRELEYGVAGS
jgi:hypothetical protein